jgi:hypothetical protein
MTVLTVSVNKPTRETLLGIGLTRDTLDETVPMTIYDIYKEGILHQQTHLTPGLRVLEINGEDVRFKNTEDVSEKLREATGVITFKVEGNIEASNEAKSPKTGLVFKDFKAMKGVMIAGISSQSIFSNDELEIGSMLRTINVSVKPTSIEGAKAALRIAGPGEIVVDAEMVRPDTPSETKETVGEVMKMVEAITEKETLPEEDVPALTESNAETTSKTDESPDAAISRIASPEVVTVNVKKMVEALTHKKTSPKSDAPELAESDAESTSKTDDSPEVVISRVALPEVVTMSVKKMVEALTQEETSPVDSPEAVISPIALAEVVTVSKLPQTRRQKAIGEYAMNSLLLEGQEDAVTAKVTKKSKVQDLGIVLKQKNGRIIVDKVKQHSPFLSWLRKGMEIKAISFTYSPSLASDAAATLDELTGIEGCELSLDSEAFVGKGNKSWFTKSAGICLRNTADGVIIREIGPTSMFSNTDLKVGMKILSVNARPGSFTASQVVDMIQESNSEVKIVANYPASFVQGFEAFRKAKERTEYGEGLFLCGENPIPLTLKTA